MTATPGPAPRDPAAATASTGSTGPTRPGPRGPDRRRTVLVAVVGGAAALLTGTAVWVRAVTASPVDGEVPVSVAGSVVAPGVNAGGLLALAAAFALALGGRWGARLAGLGILLAGVLICSSAAAGLAEPEAAARSAASEAVGVGTLVGPVEVTAAPWFAVAAGVLLVLTGAWAVAHAARWARERTGPDRHDRRDRPDLRPSDPPPSAPAGALPPGTSSGTSSGTVPVPPGTPSGSAPGTPGTTGTPPVADAGGGPEGRPVPDDHDAWDALTRGEDPT